MKSSNYYQMHGIDMAGLNQQRHSFLQEQQSLSDAQIAMASMNLHRNNNCHGLI